MRKKWLVLLAAFLLFLSPGKTFAALIAQTNQVVNSFTMGHIEVEVQETFDGVKKTNVMIQNLGTASTYIRVNAVAGWFDDQGNMAAVPTEGTYKANVVNGWVKYGGYYYCKTPVMPGDRSPVLFSSVQPNSDLSDAYENLHFGFNIVVDAVQSEGVTINGTKIVVDAWGVDPESL